MSVLEYQCPCCGATLKFASGTESMQCEYCGNTFDINVARQFTEATEQATAQSNFGWEQYEEGKEDWQGDGTEMFVYTCPSCGGQIMADANTAATRCPYCDNNAILRDRLSGVFRPDYVIPFQVPKEEAKKQLEKFCKGKKLLPKEFWKKNRIEEITGVYVPFWLFGCDSHADMQYRATKVFSWSDHDYEYTRTDHYLLLRAGDMSFDKVPVDGSAKMADNYMEAIEPYDYSAMQEFDTAYLSGYLADKYDQDAEASKPRANQRIENSTQTAFTATTLGYATVLPQSTVVRFDRGCVHYALLPVWMMNTVYQDKTYTFAMNGQTGKFVGELPISRKRYWAWVGGLFAGLGLVLGLIASLL
ncbi:MAG: hypothetical protein DBY39_01985 [Clostridiales bacterium]|nr:MAG: hypothetical protein DBY39_01985 [Clostridiales bacterium]